MTTGGKLRELTPKQERYALFLFQGLSQRDAYLKAGYSGKQGLEAIDENSCRLAKHSNILSRLAELQQAAEDDAIGTVNERRKRLTDIYRAQMVDFISPSGEPTLSKDIPHHAAVSEFSITQMSAGEEKVITKRTLKLRDPIAAIQEQNKMERIGTPESTTINFNEIKVLIVRESSPNLAVTAGDNSNGD